MAGVEERYQLLLEDPDVSKVEPHRVFCRRCAKWLKLDENKLYAASVWRCHKNTKSHNAKEPKLSASAPPPADDADSTVTINRSSSLSGSLPPNNRRKRTVSSTDSSLPSSSSANAKSPYNGGPKPPSGSSGAKKVLPRLKLRLPASLRSGSAPVSTLSGSAPNALGSSSVSINVTGAPNKSSVLTVKKSRHARSTNSVAPTDSETTPSKSNTSQESITVASFSSDKTIAPPILVNSVSQSNATSQTALPDISKSPLAGSPPSLKEPEKVSVTSEGLGPQELPPQLSPDRQASFNALLAEPAIGSLEPFRAFCSVCQHWVDLSSRTPYSYGVWKGHVRKSEKHTRLQSGSIEKEYETASDNPDDETGLSPLKAGRVEDSDVASGADITQPSLNHPSDAVNGVAKKTVDAQIPVSVETCDARGGLSASPDALSLLYPEDALSPDEPENPFVLKATTEESFRPRLVAVTCKVPPEIVEEDGDDEPASSFRPISDVQRKEPDGVQTSPETPIETTPTTTSDGEPASVVTSQNLTPSEAPPREINKSLTKALRKTLFSEHDGVPASAQARQRLAQLKALEERREAMLADPDLAIVESRRVQCRRCERWIKGSNTQEYSWHHWLKHKNKCALGQRRENDRWSVTAESRKERLEADPDLQMLEEHRALCKLCGKWVKLCSRSRYSASHWTQHKRKCPALLGIMPSNGEMHQTEPSDAGIAARSGAENKEISWMSDELRVELATDPDALQVLPHRVKCKHCDRWITLSTFMKDNKINWLLHKERCSRALANAISTPGKQIALETRKKVLEEDSDVAELEPHRVLCKACTSWVKLRQDSSYSLGNWLLHRRRCVEMTRRAVFRNHRGNKGKDDNTRPLDGTHSGSDDEDALDALDIENWLKDGPDKVPGPSPVSGGSDVVDRETSDTMEVDMEINGSGTHTRSNAGEVTFADNSNGNENEGNSPTHERPAMDTTAKRTSATAGRRRVREELNEVQAPVRGQPVGRRKGRGQAISRPTRPFLRGKGKAAAFMRGHSIMSLPPLPPRPRWPGEDERKQQFVSDPDVLRIEPHRVLCKICNCWIRLHPNVRYLETVWSRHKESCRAVHSFDSGDARSRAKSEKEEVRWRLLDEDPYATDISPHRVTCKACGTNIRLDTTYKYEGSHWRAHRSRCLRIPSQERAAKRRKTEPVKAPDSIAIADSSDSDDSDASSAPRPRPTAFFTAPLIIKPTEMFKRRSHAVQSPHRAVVNMDAEAEITKELTRVSVELESRGRYDTLLKLYGDGLVGEDRHIHPEEDRRADDDMDIVRDEDNSNALQQSDSESWAPRKRSREEYEKFDAFFSQLPAPPPTSMPAKKVRVCSLDVDAMQVVE